MNLTDEAIISNNDRIQSAKDAKYFIELNEKCLSLRIHLQKLLDLCNKLPVNDVTSLINRNNSIYLKDLLLNFTDILYNQTNIPTKKRKIENNDDLWDYTIKPQKNLKDDKWNDIINKWHGRLYYGSEKNKNKLKILNSSFYDQINITLLDKERVIEKSRLLLKDSNRLDKINDISNKYDLEVYDDRQFYSMLLKSFINSSTTNIKNLLKDNDLQELKKYRKTKDDIDRRASKGRKVRYIAHPKIQNFMFPIPKEDPLIDVDRLYQSLFQ